MSNSPDERKSLVYEHRAMKAEDGESKPSSPASPKTPVDSRVFEDRAKMIVAATELSGPVEPPEAKTSADSALLSPRESPELEHPTDSREPEEPEQPKKRAREDRSRKEDLVHIYQDAIRSLNIDFIEGTIDGQKMKVKHVVSFCKIIIDAAELPFNRTIFTAVLEQEGEDARIEHEKEKMAKHKQQLSEVQC